MKVLCGYDPGEEFAGELFAAWEGEGTRVVVSPEEGDAFEGELRDAEVLLHVLKPVTAEVLSSAPRLRLVQ